MTDHQAARKPGSSSAARATRERVGRIGLPVRARRVTRVGHQLRWHPHDPLACAEHVALQPAWQVAVVFDRPQLVGTEPFRPPDDFKMIVDRSCGGCLAADLSTPVADRVDRVCALVRVDSCPCHLSTGMTGPVGGDTSVGACHAPIKPRRQVHKPRRRHKAC